MALRRVLLSFCAGLCAAALVGCSGDTFSLDPVASAASKTAENESARIAFSATVEVSGVGPMSMSGNGLYDGRSKTGWMNMTFALPPQAQAQLGGSSPSMEAIFDASDGIVMYMRMSGIPGMPADKWMKMDLEKVADAAGLDLGSLMNANQADPSQALRMLMASSGARVTGSDTIRGVKTTRYSFRVDLERLAEDNEELMKALQLSGVGSFPAEAWIDAQGRVRRIKMQMSYGAGAQPAMTMTMTEDLYDFGVRAEIFPPPDDQVVDVTALLGRD
jgi:hypothetical protein